MEIGEVPAVAHLQAGTFTRVQAYEAGWTSRQVRRRLVAGRWCVVAGEALRQSSDPGSPWQLAFAVVLTWPDAVVSHELAGVIHGFPLDPVTVGTAIVDRPNHRTTPGLRTKRVPLTYSDVRPIGGLAMTTRPRTALDLLRTSRWTQARSLAGWLTTHEILGFSDIAREAALTPGRHGTPQLRRLVEVSAHGSLSAAEDLLHELLRCALIVGWRANVPIVDSGRIIAVADVLFDSTRLVIEVDGYAAHSSREAFQRDRTRQNQLVAANYQVLRFTWADLTNRSIAVIDEIRAALRRAA